MEWLYDTRNRTIKEMTKHSKRKRLSKLESKLLEVLLNNELNYWEDICQYMYGYYDKDVVKTVSRVKVKLLKKAKLNIEGKYSFGLKLLDNIYIL